MNSLRFPQWTVSHIFTHKSSFHSVVAGRSFKCCSIKDSQDFMEEVFSSGACSWGAQRWLLLGKVKNCVRCSSNAAAFKKWSRIQVSGCWPLIVAPKVKTFSWRTVTVCAEPSTETCVWIQWLLKLQGIQLRMNEFWVESLIHGLFNFTDDNNDIKKTTTTNNQLTCNDNQKQHWGSQMQTKCQLLANNKKPSFAKITTPKCNGPRQASDLDCPTQPCQPPQQLTVCHQQWTCFTMAGPNTSQALTMKTNQSFHNLAKFHTSHSATNTNTHHNWTTWMDKQHPLAPSMG